MRAAQILVDEGIAKPILLGNEAEIKAQRSRTELDLTGVRLSIRPPANWAKLYR